MVAIIFSSTVLNPIYSENMFMIVRMLAAQGVWEAEWVFKNGSIVICTIKFLIELLFLEL